MRPICDRDGMDEKASMDCGESISSAAASSVRRRMLIIPAAMGVGEDTIKSVHSGGL